jgi:hypothetical protein
MEFNTKMINSKVGLLSYAWFVGGDELYQGFNYYIGDDEDAQEFIELWDGKDITLKNTLTQMIYDFNESCIYDEYYNSAKYI